MDSARKEILGAAVFGASALFFLFLGMFNFRSHLYMGQLDKPPQQKIAQVAPEEVYNPAIADTDQDGLTDLEEINLHETSIYIQDTDSDGVSDGEEVKRGTNPLCPYQDNCLRGTLGIQLPNLQDNFVDFSGGVNPDLANKSINIQNLTPQELRELLIENGGSPDEINKIPDEKLLEIYQGTLANVGLRPEEQVINTFITQDPIQMRKLLLDHGVPRDVLDSVTDDELREIFTRVVQEQ